MPWSNFVGHAHWQRVHWIPFAETSLHWWFILDFFGNIVLFLPFGGCGVLSMPHRSGRRRVLRAAGYAALLSLSVEFFQVYCHNRSPAMTDVCTNVTGALLGAWFIVRPPTVVSRLLRGRVWGCCWLLLLLGGGSASADQPPNIVMIYADDLGWSDVGFNGRTEWQTPHLDRLAQQGMVFDRWYSAAAVCAPSRAAFLTGKYPIHNGVTGNLDDLPDTQVTIAEALKSYGYVTGLFGKWHRGCESSPMYGFTHPMDQGFDEFFGFTDARHAWEQFPKELWVGREHQPVSGYANTLFTDRSIDFISRHHQQPFFLYVPYIATHFYIQAPEDDVAEYRGKFAEKDPRQPFNAIYAAMVTRMDKEIGRILQTLESFNLTRRTLVVFSSDQGATFEQENEGASAYHSSNRPFRGQKRTLWEGGIRVPAVVRWPGKIPAGRRSSVVTSMIDLMPTFLAAASLRPQRRWKVDGRNMLPVWQGKRAAPERILFWEWRGDGSTQLAAMLGKFKLIVTEQNPPELFDVEADPGEQRSVIAEHKTLAVQLQHALDTWLRTEILKPPCRERQ